jgi:hypothetical protein
MTQQQIEQFKAKAKAIGKSDAQINAFIKQKQQEASTGLFSPRTEEPKEGEPFSLKTPSAKDEKKSVGGFAMNVLKSGGKFIKDTAVGLKDVVIHPKRTLENIGDPLAGAAMLGIKKATGTKRFDNAPEIDKAKAVGGFYKDRYGGVKQIKNTLYNDPVGALSDASVLLSGAGAVISKAGTVSKIGTVTKAGNVISKACEVTNPINIAGKAVATASKPLAGSLEKSAITDYSQALNPTTKENKFLTQKTVPKLLEKGEKAFSLQGLEKKAQTNISKAGQQLDDIESAIPPKTQIKTQKILDDLENYKKEFYTTTNKGKRVALEPDKIRATEELQEIIRQFDGSASFESLQKAKRVWAETIAEAKGYAGKTFSEGSKLKVKDIATDAIRTEIAKEFPDLAKINAEYSFWKNVEKITSDTIKRKTGQATPLNQNFAQQAGQGAGIIRGTVSDAIFIGQAFKNATKLFQSAGYRMISASAKYKLAKLIAKGNIVEANNLIAQLLNTLAFFTRQEQNQPESLPEQSL